TSNTTSDLIVCGGPAANNVYAGGAGGFITHWGGSSWSPTGYSSGTTQTIRSATGGATGIYLVGDNGTITYGADGMTFTPQTSGTTQALYGVENANGSGTQLYAVGANGTVL